MFFHFKELEIPAAMLLLVVLSACALACTRRRKRWMRLAAVLWSGVAGLFFFSLLLLMIFEFILRSKHGQPIYSPDHKVAALVFYNKKLDGTFVQLYSLHGLHQDPVFYSAEGKSVEDTDLRWVDNKHLVIQYQRRHRPYYGDAPAPCRSADDIEVQCIAKPTP